jgi:hypothetical protein
MDVSDDTGASGCFTPEEREHVTHSMEFGGHWCQFGRCGVDRKFIPLPGIEPRAGQPSSPLYRMSSAARNALWISAMPCRRGYESVYLEADMRHREDPLGGPYVLYHAAPDTPHVDVCLSVADGVTQAPVAPRQWAEQHARSQPAH